MCPDSVSILLIGVSWCGECPKRFDEVSVAEHYRYGKSSVMVWAGISINGKTTDLYVIENGTLKALGYCNEIFKRFARPNMYAGAIGQEFILMDYM